MDRGFRWQQRANRRPIKQEPESPSAATGLPQTTSPSQLSPYHSLTGEQLSDYLYAVKSSFACEDLLDLWNDLWFGNAEECISTSYDVEPWQQTSNGASSTTLYDRLSTASSDRIKHAYSSPTYQTSAMHLNQPSTSSEDTSQRLSNNAVASTTRGNTSTSRSTHQPPDPSTPAAIGIGTWANRQYFMPLPEQAENGGHDPENAVFTAEDLAGSHSDFGRCAESSLSGSAEENAVAAAAWRWRFTRKWQAEQLRALDPATASEADKSEEALQYLNAVGPAWNLHLPRNESSDLTLGSQKSGGLSWAGTFGPASALAADILLEESYGRKQPLSHALKLDKECVTPDVTKVAKRADELLAHQSNLERQAQERWNELGGSSVERPWVGELMNVVEIDDWGTFRFIVARLTGPSGRQKILLRGRNFCSEVQLEDGINREIAEIAQERELLKEVCTVVGGGTMEWRRDRDRHLHLHSGFMNKPMMPVTNMHATDVLKLAGVLAKQSLPMNYRVVVDGYKAL